jgi:hypothetical protein
MKKPFISELFVFVFIAFFLIGCVPSAQSTSIPLEIDDQKISLEFQQNDVNIPVSSHEDQWEVTLGPEPFTLIVNGDKKIVSVMALKSADLVLPLQQSSKTLVTIPGTGNIFSQNDLYLINQPLEIYDLNTYTLQHLSYFSFSSEKAANTVDTLKNQFGTEPLALFSPRSYINMQLGQDQNYLIKTINGSAIQNGESIVLLVFVEKQSNDPLFSVLKWLVVNLVFE